MYDYFSRYYDLIFPFRQATYDFLNQFISEHPANILDLGCGTGTYLTKFSQSGHQVVGVDLNEEMLNIARQKCPEGHWLALDLKDLSELKAHLPENFRNGFDLIFCTGNVFSYFNEEELAKIVKDIFYLLKVNGTWTFQIVNWQKILRQKDFTFPLIENQEHQLKFYRFYHEVNENEATFETKLEQQGKIIFQDRHRLFAHTQAEMQKIHQTLPFKEERFLVILPALFLRKKNPQPSSGCFINKNATGYSLCSAMAHLKSTDRTSFALDVLRKTFFKARIFQRGVQP